VDAGVAFSEPYQQVIPGVLAIAEAYGAVFGFGTQTLPMLVVVVDHADVTDGNPALFVPTFTAFVESMTTHDWLRDASDRRNQIWNSAFGQAPWRDQ